eukprot:2878876-Ditylum_brightwellii.AAC.1
MQRFLSDSSGKRGYGDAIKRVDQLPTDIPGLKWYFHNLYIPGKTTFIWPSVCLGFNCNMQSLSRDLAIPLGYKDITMYMKKLQKCDTTK